MLISIVVPIYNVEQYILNCLNSIIVQTYQEEIECIIVNDATQDSSYDIAEEFVLQYKGRINFKIISHKENRGLSVARNTGLLNASGDYVLFVDSDDELYPDCLETLSKPLIRNPYDVIVGSHSVLFEDRTMSSVEYIEAELNSKGDILSAYIDGQWGVTAWNKLCKRKWLIDNGLFFKEGLVHEDDMWSLQLANNALSLYVLPKPTYMYQARRGSILGLGRSNIKLQLERKILLYKAISKYVNALPFKHYLNNVYLEQKRINFLNDLYVSHERGVIKDLYKQFHLEVARDFTLKGLNIKEKLRDIHFGLPNCVAFYVWYIYRMLTEMFR